MEETKGASDSEFACNILYMQWLISGLDERLFAAARTDNEELLLEIFNSKSKIDINCQDGWAIIIL